MGDYVNKSVKEIISDYINDNTYLPAIQREYVWGTSEICKLFDSLMCGYPISSFLFWRIREENKKQWTAYEFIRNFDADMPHNKEANLNGVNKDIFLVLDGQQRLTSLFIGLKGSYSYFHYRKKTEVLAIDLLQEPNNEINTDELQYGFKFIEQSEFNNSSHFWYKVGDILNHDRAREAKDSIKTRTNDYSSEHQRIIENNLEDLFDMIQKQSINYYEEKTNNYDKVVEIFVRTNTGGVKLEYSDILLTSATAKWKNLNAREEIHNFTDEINKIGSGYKFGKDLVMKGAMYLTEGLPIKYKVSSFTKENLEKIENNWDKIKDSLSQTVLLLSRFGFTDKNIISRNAILPIAFYINKFGKSNFVTSSDKELVKIKNDIQIWFSLNILRNVFGGSSDTKLQQCQEILAKNRKIFPWKDLFAKFTLNFDFTNEEIEGFLKTTYRTKHSYLLLSLLYPNRDWIDNNYAEDHIYPKSEFTKSKLQKRGYSDEKIQLYLNSFNTIVNLELLEDVENKEKNAKDFNDWIKTRDENFKTRHLIPNMDDYSFDNFLEFVEKRKELLQKRYKEINFS